MSQDISRRRLSPVQLSAQYRAQIADCDLHGRCRSSFRLTRYVDGWKRQSQSRRRIDACCGEEGADIAYGRMASGMFVGKKDYVADYAGQRRGHNEDISAAKLLGCYGVDNSERGC